LDLPNENEQLPALVPFRAAHLHNGRERIRVREIHQMNYFDDEVCLRRMPGWGQFSLEEWLMTYLFPGLALGQHATKEIRVFPGVPLRSGR
jgi:hypothetical protein